MIPINQIVCVAFLYLTWILSIEGRRRNSYNTAASQAPPLPPPPPPISYDSLGNCYVGSGRLRGQCVRYQQCFSAVQNWQYYRQLPFSCYYNNYDNFVCCPEAYVSTTPTTAPSPIYYPQRPNPFLPSITTNTVRQEERLSEIECSSIYNQASRPNRRHRSRRSANASSSYAETSALDEISEPVQEELIEKKEVKQTQAVGGVPTYRDEFPYMCALGWRTSSSKHAGTTYNCGCVLIAQKYVLTAAHCATLGGESPTMVRLGGADLDERHAEMIKIKRIIQHPDYDSKLAYNDIAVVKLEKSSRETPACIWTNEGLPQQMLTAIGYGQTKFAGPSSTSLLKVFLKVLTNENCNSYYSETGDKLPNGVDVGQICAGDPEGKMDTCQGDSGGPLLITESKYNRYVPYIVGLTSFGEGCASGVPSIYTRISYFIDWIENEVWK